MDGRTRLRCSVLCLSQRRHFVPLPFTACSVPSLQFYPNYSFYLLIFYLLLSSSCFSILLLALQRSIVKPIVVGDAMNIPAGSSLRAGVNRSQAKQQQSVGSDSSPNQPNGGPKTNKMTATVQTRKSRLEAAPSPAAPSEVVGPENNYRSSAKQPNGGPKTNKLMATVLTKKSRLEVAPSPEASSEVADLENNNRRFCDNVNQAMVHRLKTELKQCREENALLKKDREQKAQQYEMERKAWIKQEECKLQKKVVLSSSVQEQHQLLNDKYSNVKLKYHTIREELHFAKQGYNEKCIENQALTQKLQWQIQASSRPVPLSLDHNNLLTEPHDEYDRRLESSNIKRKEDKNTSKSSSKIKNLKERRKSKSKHDDNSSQDCSLVPVLPRGMREQQAPQARRMQLSLQTSQHHSMPTVARQPSPSILKSSSYSLNHSWHAASSGRTTFGGEQESYQTAPSPPRRSSVSHPRPPSQNMMLQKRSSPHPAATTATPHQTIIMRNNHGRRVSYDGTFPTSAAA
jgi:hypothetical protein